jgi:hypothetical protein
MSNDKQKSSKLPTSKSSVGDPIDFSELILGFSSAALLYLGEAGIATEQTSNLNLPLAKHNIDILELLRQKTKGNTTSSEAELLDEVLSDLRLKYAKIAG